LFLLTRFDARISAPPSFLAIFLRPFCLDVLGAAVLLLPLLPLSAACFTARPPLCPIPPALPI
jgi:hypothetical protein